MSDVLDELLSSLSSEGRDAINNVFRVLRRQGTEEQQISAIAKAVSEEMRASASSQSESSHPSESFLARAKRLDDRGATDSALDLVYDAIDELMKTGELLILDSTLRDMQVQEYSLDLLLGVLTATLPVRTRLSARKGFFQRVKGHASELGETDPGLLAGLE
jgi:hypothetical protein